jgi:hypothetical protein
MTTNAEATEARTRDNQRHTQSKHPGVRGTMMRARSAVIMLRIVHATILRAVLGLVGDEIGGARNGDIPATATAAAVGTVVRSAVIIATMRRRGTGYAMN